MMGYHVACCALLCTLFAVVAQAQQFQFSDTFTECKRVGGKERVLSIFISGVRGDYFQSRLSTLPNINRLVGLGVSTACPTYNSESCARTHMGNRYAPRTVSIANLDIQNASNVEELDILLDSYTWGSFSGYGSISAGLDTSHTKIKNNRPVDGILFERGTEKAGGTFFKRAKEAGKRTALVGYPGFLSSTDEEGLPKYGVLDYECGAFLNDEPIVSRNEESSCNLDYRFPISLSDTRADTLAKDWIKLILNRGCARINAIHFKSVDATMHDRGMGSAAYDWSLTVVDSFIGELISVMDKEHEERGYRFLVSVTSDHGGIEADKASYVDVPPLLQRLDHGRNWAYDEAIPFVLAPIGDQDALSALVHPVRNFDLYPTFLEYLGVKYETQEIDGKPQGLDSAGDRLVYHLGLVLGAIILGFW